MPRTWIRHDGNYPRGYGEADAALADALFGARTQAEAEAAVAEHGQGLGGIQDAIDWLASRSG